MNVLIVAASKYGNKEAIRKRIRKGANTAHTTYRRKGDLTMKRLCEEAGVEIPVFKSRYGWRGEAYENELMNAMDYIIVYDAPSSSVTPFYTRKAKEWPYSLIYGKKVEIIKGRKGVG